MSDLDRDAVPTSLRFAIISAGVGAGHDGPADEITRRLRSRGHQVTRLEGLDVLPGRSGSMLREAYFAQLRLAPNTWGALLELTTRPWALDLIHGALDKLVTRALDLLGGPVDAVVSTYPVVSQLLGRLRQQGKVQVPVVSYLTDAAAHPLWIHPDVDLILCPHPYLAEQVTVMAQGQPTDVVACTPIVDSAFARTVAPSVVQSLRTALGVTEGQNLALVTSGSAGTGDVCATARDVVAFGATPVVACGHSTALRRRAERLGAGPVLGWVDDMPGLLAAIDIVIQNAGGLSCWEALRAGRPVVSYRVLPGHGAANAAVLEAAGLVPWLRSRQQLGRALATTPPPASVALGPDAADVIEQRAYQARRPPSSSGVDPAVTYQAGAQ